jgi:hypothetical protein
MKWKTIDQVYDAVDQMEGMKVSIRKDGASPYSPFDAVIYPEGFRLGMDPGEYKISGIHVKSCDPAKSYKGRHGTGRLIHVSPKEGGLVEVDSNEGETKLVLECGMLLGHKPERIETLDDWFSEDQIVWSSEDSQN